jgi:hypothetical protein
MMALQSTPNLADRVLGQNPHHLAHAKIVAGGYFLMK